MATLIYSVITSLDGYIEDEGGRFDWAEPDEEVHTFVNDLERPVGTYLYGRRMYEVMAVWETALADADQPSYTRTFAEIWQAAEKVVYSRTLERPWTARTRLEDTFAVWTSTCWTSGGSARQEKPDKPPLWQVKAKRIIVDIPSGDITIRNGYT